MWIKLAHTIIRYRFWLMIILAIITAFMAYKAQELEVSYDYVEAVPSSDPDMVYYDQFKEQFGEDANVLAIGLRDSALYQVENFQKYKYFSEEVTKLEGVKYALSLPSMQKLVKNTESKQFELAPVFVEIPNDQAGLDTLLQQANDQKFYSGQLINEENGATFMLIAIEKKTLNSDKRQQLILDIQQLGESFSEITGIELHYAGIPFVRTIMNAKVQSELQIFLILSVLVTACILLLFFRSWDAVIFPLIIIGIMVVWSMGTLALFNYDITVLSGLLPPIIVVIGIPNSVYLLNKYHQEYNRHGDKIKALTNIIEKIGLATLITNVTTAIGFLVLIFTEIAILEEFGLVAGLNILATFIVSIILIPAVFSYLPPPSSRQLKHLRFRMIDRVLTLLDLLVHRHKYRVMMGAIAVVAVFAFGMFKIEAVSFLVDDVPNDSELKRDLAFFEDNFTGIMPLEVVIDTQQKRAITRVPTLQKVDNFQQYLAEQPEISEPISIVGFIKAARQAFYNNSPAFYALPDNRDKAFVFRYLQNSQAQGLISDEETDENNEAAQMDLLSNFSDSTGQQIRISLKIADIGSNEIKTLINEKIRPKAEEIFDSEETKINITGASLLFTKGNEFLIDNLLVSLLLAFCLIALIMAMLFGSFRMILISLVPNLIPLIITAGIMGFVGIPLKPSTAIIFSIVFGISVDDSIHFLAKYRQELKLHKAFVPIAISKSLRETGTSMIYTSTILFFGFIIFAGSSFGGTMYLGILTSLTLLIAMFTNLTILPALLMAFDNGKGLVKKHDQEIFHLIEHYDEFYQEDEDEEIDLEKIERPNGSGQNEEVSNENRREN
ncbi:putative RND superfamily exporter protein [Catalinimonas alkaloidigena]|uniref:efflux RND transporter permease subunit n=1 Tax=Catalinimonas alkaloidigena TaxID=1075417 RepID=UPI002404A397|nr:efflux RND transporter permease subunit [Catalinimonas alkaloidigena]MDF9800003.1 putative RND superfamily exporter protein [Catalinimonas alkaloidigena]